MYLASNRRKLSQGWLRHEGVFLSHRTKSRGRLPALGQWISSIHPSTLANWFCSHVKFLNLRSQDGSWEMKTLSICRVRRREGCSGPCIYSFHRKQQMLKPPRDFSLPRTFPPDHTHLWHQERGVYLSCTPLGTGTSALGFGTGSGSTIPKDPPYGKIPEWSG